MEMENTSKERVLALREVQTRALAAGKTLDIGGRKRNLKALRTAVLKWEQELAVALWKDLHKSYEEAYLTEISIVRN